MQSAGDHGAQQQQVEKIEEFVTHAKGLQLKAMGEDQIQITQVVDGKAILVSKRDVEEVILRVDSDGQAFQQVNFVSGKKILITDSLIGFKPFSSSDIDVEKLPKVVTTPDLISIVEAIEDTYSLSSGGEAEVEVLKKVFLCVLRGAEAVGFDLSPERIWLQSLGVASTKATA